MVGGEDIKEFPQSAAATEVEAAATNDNNNNDNNKISEEKKTDEGPASTISGSILRTWTHSTAEVMTVTPDDDCPQKAPLGAFEDSNVDDTPYEHGFEPGDHIIRWDMLPILWPIQIHGIVLEVSDDKTTVTICDFGITTVKNDAVEKKMAKADREKDVEKMLEEENAKFTEAIQDEGDDGKATQSDGSNDANAVDEDNKKGSKNRLNIVILTKWSDLRKWKKVNYEGQGLLKKGGGMGKNLEKLGKKTEQLWSSVTKSFVRKESTESKKVVHHAPSVRHDVNDEGYCVHHPEIQLQRRREGKGDDGQGDWSIVRKKCPECILEDCPAMMGGGSPPSRTATIESEPTFSSVEEEEGREDRAEECKKTNAAASSLSDSDSIQAPSGLSHTRATSSTSREDNQEISTDASKTDPKDALEEPTTLAQMITEANDIDKCTVRKAVVKTAPASPAKEQSFRKLSSWRQGSFMKSVSGLFSSQKSEKEEESPSTETSARSSDAKGEIGEAKANELPRSDPAVLVLARTRFILEHGEEILPPYHIINSNSECIAVWCKTGRWSTLQASVFLHSTAIGNAKSSTVAGIGVAAANPFLIPLMAGIGIAAVGTPWLLLKMANDKWTEATMSLNDQFWMQAKPEVFVDCIEKWSKLG